MKKINLITLALVMIGVAVAVISAWSGQKTDSPSLRGIYTDTFNDFGINTSSTVNTTSTQILASSSTRAYARITNVSVNRVSCGFDNETAASSSIQVDEGLTLSPLGVTTGTVGMNYVEIGRCSTCIPYTGSVNCRALATSSVGVIQN